MIFPKETVLIGLSGGADSVCLLLLLCEIRDSLGIVLHAVYIDHGLRPQEAPEEMTFCRNLCAAVNVSFTTRSVDVPSSPLTAKYGTQGAARELRYRALGETALQAGATKIALAHTSNDNAETLLLHLFRGTGMKGLGGIPPVRGNFIRPLIDIARSEIEDFLRLQGQPFLNDPSNLRTDYLRNRLRIRLMPEVEKINPSVVETLARTAVILREEDDFLEGLVTKNLMRLVSRKSDSRIELFLTPLEATHQVILRRIIRRALASLDPPQALSFRHSEDVIRLIKAGRSGDRIHLPNGLRAIREYAILVFTTDIPQPLGTYTIAPGETVVLPESGLVLACSLSAVDEGGHAKGQAVFDSGKITSPLLIRARRPGDFFYPSGFGRKKKLQDFFVDNKIPREERDSLPLICSGDEIIWVVGHRTDQRFLPDASTREFLVLTARRAKT